MCTQTDPIHIVDPIEIAAMAIYETDEDMVDENMAHALAKGDTSWSELRYPRLGWGTLAASVQTAYRRRARAAFAAVAYQRQQDATLAAIPIGRRRFTLVEFPG